MSEREKAVEGIKRLAPASLKVTLRDGTEKPVAVPKQGNRWSRVQQVLDALPWVAIECLDKAGGLLGVIEDDEELEELVDDGNGNVGMARVLLEVMRLTMKEVKAMFEVQLRGTASVMQCVVDGQNAMVESYKTALVTQQQYALAAGASPDDNKEMVQMMQMAMGLMAQQKAKGGG
jgi:hypothetical protein